MKFCSPQKFEENSTNFPVGYCFSQHEFSGGSSCLPIIWHDFLCENSFYSNFPWKFLMKILSVRYVCCRVPVEDELHVSQSKTRTCVIKTLGLIMSRVSDNILKPFLTNLPCLCPEKADITSFVSLKACKLKWFVCQPVFFEQEMLLAVELAVRPYWTQALRDLGIGYTLP